MQEVVKKERCVGCEACANICPKGCISMEEDAEGFFYPNIRQAQCVNCGQCLRVCPSLHAPDRTQAQVHAYGAYNRDWTARMQSSSGGIFPLLAEQVIKRGGMVFGAAFDEKFRVVHQKAETMEQAKAFRGSKYAQSRIGDTYRQVKQALETGRQVLFTGTPCQIAGLLNFLGGTYENLLCQDMVCHSVPSPGVWRDHIKFRQANRNATITEVNFRSKQDGGWERYQFRIQYDGGTAESWAAAQSPYLRAFLGGLISRPACHNCPFKGLKRASDITLADFWGVQDICPEIYCAEGTSLLLVHTEKGQQLLEQIGERIQFCQVVPEKAVQANLAACSAIPAAKRRALFWKNYSRADQLEALVERCLKPPVRQRLVQQFRKSLLGRAGNKVKNIVRKAEKWTTKHSEAGKKF